MTEQIRLSFLGVQHYHANFWVNALKRRDYVDIIGVWDPDEELSGKFSKAHELAQFRTMSELLSNCDAVAICSATSDHRTFIEAAANAGLAILCEKPLATNQQDNEAILSSLARTKVRFMQSFPKRLDPATDAVRELVSSGDLGQITLVRVRHGHSHGFSNEFKKAWYVNPALSGGGTLLDEGVHAADFLRYVFGEPETAFGALSNQTLGLPVEDTALAVFTYEDGLIAEVSTSWCFAAADASIEIYGTEGTALLSGVDIASRPTREKDFLTVFKRAGSGGSWSARNVIPHFKTGVFHEYVAWAFADALRTGAPMPATAEDGARAFAMIQAAYVAHETGQRQKIDYGK